MALSDMFVDPNNQHSNQDNELWVSMAHDDYPGLSSIEYRLLRDEAVMEWLLDSQSPKAVLYEKYYLIKTLMQS